MNSGRSWLPIVVFALALCRVTSAQDLSPRAYIISPLHSNAVTLSYGFYDGSLIFDGSVPISDATARVSVPVISLFHSFGIFGRSANFVAALPYGNGNFKGTVTGAEVHAYRSGLFPPTFRLSVNLLGGPAMGLKEFSKWRQKHILGVSIKLVPPAGQYDPSKVINFGTNRWAVKTEVGYSRRWGHWILDTYAGAWLYSTNDEFFPGANRQSQNSTGAFEGHLSYDFRPRLWVSLDGNYWFGGVTSLNGVANPGTNQRNSRIGVTGSVPFSRHQSFKVSYSRGAYILYGGNYNNLTVAWQYSWFGRPN